MIKIGDKRYAAYIDDVDGSVDMNTHVIINIQNRKPTKYSTNRIKYGFMIEHIHGVTWVKKSKKHGDFGYDTKCNPFYKTRFRIEDGAPYSASKAGAVRKMVADIRDSLKRWGNDNGEGFLTHSEMLKRALTYQKRIKS